MTSLDFFWKFAADYRPPPLSRLAKKHRSRYRASCRRQLRRLAGHACRHRLDEAAWAKVKLVVFGWNLEAPLSVPRSLRPHLGKAVGSPWQRAYRSVVGQASAMAFYWGQQTNAAAKAGGGATSPAADVDLLK